MKLFISVAAVAVVLLAGTIAPAQSPTVMTVVRDPGCGCCMNWVAHLRRAGFTVTVTESASRLRDTRVPAEARSCHTGSIGGYLIEGHVPAADIKRLLIERPAIAGLAVPGMPVGSPGMEQGARTDPYSVMAFDKAGKMTVHSSHRGE